MQVIGIGFGRTGTASLKEALERLGYGPCYHMHDVVAEPERIRHWQRAAGGDPIEWEDVFAGFGSAVDWPVAAFWRELADHYPEAKLVLTVRDPDRWYDSAVRTIFKQAVKSRSPVARAGLRVVTGLSPDLKAFVDMTDAAILSRVFEGRIAEREFAIERYRRHVREVRAEIDPERLLEYDVADGWRPLCDFLGVEVPAGTEFPRSNASESFDREDARRMARLVFRPVTSLVRGRG